MNAQQQIARCLDARLVVCVGTGGVGKTTCAAALALGAARRGRRVAVMTIDPARRLADALGAGELGDEPRALGAEARERLGLSGPGELFACTLDTRRTFDRLVERFAPDAATRERIERNPLYQQLSTSLAGSAEYAAMERVYEIAADARFDLVVVDTPPAQHALDFLEAPSRLADFLDSRLVQVLLHPAMAAGRFGLRLFEGAIRRVLAQIERISGLEFLEDLSELLIAIESLTQGLQGRASELAQLLRGDQTRFVLVTGPSPGVIRAGERFLAQLGDAGVHASGIVANRVRCWPGEPASAARLRELAGDATRERAAREALARALREPLGDPDLASRAASAAIDVAKGYALRVAMDEGALEPLRRRAAEAGLFFAQVPEFEADVHDLIGLAHVEAALLGPLEERA